MGQIMGVDEKKIEMADVQDKTPEEILSMAKDEGIELSDEQLEGIAGGGMWDKPGADGCPSCGSHDISYSNVGQTVWMTCRNCGHKWC